MLHQQVLGADVAVDPDGWAVPGRGQGRLPQVRRGVGIDAATQHVDRVPRLGVVGCKRRAAKEIVMPRRGSTRRVDSIQGSQKVRQCGRELDLISYRLNARSEERRVGKEWRALWSACHHES